MSEISKQLREASISLADVADKLDEIDELPEQAIEHAASLAPLVAYMSEYTDEDPFAEALVRLRVLEKIHDLDVLADADFDDIPATIERVSDAHMSDLAEALRERVGHDWEDQISTAFWRAGLVGASAGAAEIADVLASIVENATRKVSA